ncbi:hypothetical protein Ddc_04577 [Ditylenchus destructor]|nr:hypothetical protein Ddc_04577 [Ditylenchus destructor]
MRGSDVAAEEAVINNDAVIIANPTVCRLMTRQFLEATVRRFRKRPFLTWIFMRDVDLVLGLLASNVTSVSLVSSAHNQIRDFTLNYKCRRTLCPVARSSRAIFLKYAKPRHDLSYGKKMSFLGGILFVMHCPTVRSTLLHSSSSNA